jgi:hypothetical protein
MLLPFTSSDSNLSPLTFLPTMELHHFVSLIATVEQCRGLAEIGVSEQAEKQNLPWHYDLLKN